MAYQVSLSKPLGLSTGMAINSLRSHCMEYKEGNWWGWLVGGPFYYKYMSKKAEKVNTHNLQIKSIYNEIKKKSHRLEENLPPKFVVRVYKYLSESDLERLNFEQIRGYITPNIQKSSSILENLLARNALNPEHQKIWTFLHELPGKTISEIWLYLEAPWLKKHLKEEPGLLETIGQLLSEEQYRALSPKLINLLKEMEQENPCTEENLVKFS